MAETETNRCAECQRLQAQLDQLQAAVTRLQEQLAAARKDSSTSSKPPSSDIVKPPASVAPGGGKRKPGGQPGHPLHERALFPPEQIDLFLVHPLHGCPCCGGQLRLNGQEARVVQQVDLEPAKLTIEQHTCPEYWCVCCERSYKASVHGHRSPIRQAESRTWEWREQQRIPVPDVNVCKSNWSSCKLP
jgi:transposase